MLATDEQLCKKRFAQIHEIKPIIMFHVIPLSILNVSFNATAMKAIYEAY
jgi:hypothetical protein